MRNKSVFDRAKSSLIKGLMSCRKLEGIGVRLISAWVIIINLDREVKVASFHDSVAQLRTKMKPGGDD